jgi:hypothetical protein
VTLVTDITYGDAETRGRLRIWKRRLAERYAAFDRVYQATRNGKGAATEIGDLVGGSRSTREKALGKLTKAFGPGVVLEWAKLEKRGEAVAVWSILKPRESVTVEITREVSAGERASLVQDCVSVNYVVAGTKRLLIADGLWTLEVPDHALGRAVERSRFLTPEAIIREAHLNLLNAPMEAADRPTPYIKAGPGCFVGGLHFGNDVTVGQSVHARVKTWLEESMLGPDQVPLRADGAPGKRMGDAFLMPRPLWTSSFRVKREAR